MRCGILSAVEGLRQRIAASAAALGVSASDVVRVYSPEYFLDSMESGRTYLAVFLQDVTIDDEEIPSHLRKTVSVRAAICRKVNTLDCPELDSVVNTFEAFQNMLSHFQHWQDSAGYDYALTSAKSAGFLDDEALTSAGVAMCGFDLEIQTLVNIE